MPIRIDQLTAITAANTFASNLSIEVFDHNTGASREMPLQELLDMATKDYYMEVAAGNVDGASPLNKFGRTTNADVGIATDIWDGANATDDEDVWIAPTAARVHSIASDSADDDGSPVGGGARTVKVYGLTSWSAAETSETLTMDGTTGVNTALSYVIIHRIKVLTSGSSGPNVGTITATAATDGTVTARVLPDEGQTQMAIYGVPSTQSLFLKSFYASVLSGSNKAASANVELLWTPDVANEEGVFQVKSTQGLYDPGVGSLSHPYNPPNKFTGPGILKLRVTTDQADCDVSGGFDGVMVDH